MKQRFAEIWILVTDDKKKAGVLGGLFLLLFFMGIRGFITKSPASASASTGSQIDGAVGDALSGSTIRTLVSIDGIGGSRVISIEEPRPVNRDLFEISEKHFPQTVQTDQLPNDGGKSDPRTADTEGVGPSEAVRSPEERIAEEASVLELRSTLVGENPVAIIVSGSARHVVSHGDSVDGFVVIEIRSHSVLLEKEGISVEVTRH